MNQSFSGQSSDSFARLLNQAGCSLLVSTCQAGQLVLVRPQDGDKGVNAHFIGKERLWFLFSGAGQLMCANPGQPVAELSGFARGPDFIDRYALIGLSQVRESAVFAGLPLTRRVAERKSGVWVVDTVTGETVAFLQFTGNVQEVFEIKVLPHRMPMLLDADSPLLASSYELPEEVLKNLAPPDPVAQALEAATRQHLEGELEQAIETYQQLLTDQPDHARTRHQLGLCLVGAERWAEAVSVLEQVVEERSDNAEAMNSLGLAFTRLGDFDQGMYWLDQAIATDKQFALAHFNRGIVLLKQGDYVRGLEAYDWRWQTPRFVPFQCQQPQWQGEDISEQRLLVHSEQGNGDHIQFMRFLPLAARRCRELIYVGPEKLAPLVGLEGVSFYSLQMPLSSGELTWLTGHKVLNLEPELPGYARTAALIEQLDMVVSVDTATCHIACALGIPTLILLGADPDWRWLREGETSPWYPTATLVRQSAPGQWQPVLARVAELLASARDKNRPALR